MTGNCPAVLNFNRYFSNWTGSFVTNCRFSVAPDHSFGPVNILNNSDIGNRGMTFEKPQGLDP